MRQQAMEKERVIVLLQLNSTRVLDVRACSMHASVSFDVVVVVPSVVR